MPRGREKSTVALTAPPSFETARLVLRLPSIEDALAIFDAYAGDALVPRYMTWRAHPNADVTRAFVEDYCLGGLARGDVLPWLITHAADGRVAGMVDLRLVGTRAELGYVLARRDWGRGLASEAARVVVDWAIAQEELHRVWAVVDLEHVASQRVLEKTGMVREGLLRRWIVLPNIGPIPRDVWCYARIKSGP